MHLSDGSRVLEIGCGPGFFSQRIAASLPLGRLTLLDLQPAMLELAEQRLAGRRHVSFVTGDASALPFARAFDVVFIAAMLGEVPDRETCVAGLRRVLQPGGVAIVAETRRDSDFIPLAKLRDLFDRHGFSFEGRHGISWQYVARFRPRESVVPDTG
jgi:ubiquinone/menaquinone biosynthesis C-methylase UbiE